MFNRSTVSAFKTEARFKIGDEPYLVGTMEYDPEAGVFVEILYDGELQESYKKYDFARALTFNGHEFILGDLEETNCFVQGRSKLTKRELRAKYLIDGQCDLEDASSPLFSKIEFRSLGLDAFCDGNDVGESLEIKWGDNGIISLVAVDIATGLGVDRRGVVATYKKKDGALSLSDVVGFANAFADFLSFAMSGSYPPPCIGLYVEYESDYPLGELWLSNAVSSVGPYVGDFLIWFRHNR